MVRTEIWYTVSFKGLDMMVCQTNSPLQLVSLVYHTSLVRYIWSGFNSPAIFNCVPLAVEELAGIKRKLRCYLGIFDS
jgi:hypothetical protein